MCEYSPTVDGSLSRADATLYGAAVVMLAMGPALFLALEAHMYLRSEFKLSMRILVPLGALALLLCLAIRCGRGLFGREREC